MVRTLVGTMLERSPRSSRRLLGGPPAAPRRVRPRRPGASTSCPSGYAGYDQRVRFPVVLFDLDGTVVDSGAIILASMRHADARPCSIASRRRGADEGRRRPGLEAQMRRSIRSASTSSCASTGRTTSRCTTSWRRARGMDDVLAPPARARAAGSGIVTAKRRSTVELAFAQLPLGHLFETVVGGDETEQHKPHPEPLLLALERSASSRRRPLTSATRRSTCRRPRQPGMYAVGVTWGGIHDRERARAEEPDAIVDAPEELLEPRLSRGRRAARPAQPLPARVPRARRPDRSRRDVRPALRRARRTRGGAPGARHAGLADPARRRAAVVEVPEGAAPDADGLAREGDDRRGAREVGRRRAQAPRRRRAGRLRARAEDRRLAINLIYENGVLRARRDARRRRGQART